MLALASKSKSKNMFNSVMVVSGQETWPSLLARLAHQSRRRAWRNTEEPKRWEMSSPLNSERKR
jgi:hypothetical protein